MARTCPSCAFELGPRAAACPRCGTSLAPEGPDPSAADGGRTPGAADGGDGGSSAAPDDAPEATAPPPRPADRPPGGPPTDPAPDAGTLGQDVRNWAMAAHLAAYSVFLVPIPVIGPVIVWAVKRDEHPFIDHHGREAVNFNLSVLIYAVVAAVSLLLLVGVVLLPLVFLLWFIVTIVAALKAAAGEWYRCPMTIRFLN